MGDIGTRSSSAALQGNVSDGDSDDSFTYEDIDLEGADLSSEDDADDATLKALEDTVKTIRQERIIASSAPAVPGAETVKGQEKVEDFFRNWLIRAEMTQTLQMFQMEWYDQVQSNTYIGQSDTLPDVYAQLTALQGEIESMKAENAKWKEIAHKARGTWDKLRKERDFHRMHHRRVVQEKQRLVTDLKRLKRHADAFQPSLDQLKAKYEAAMKEKMLLKLDRDKLRVKNDSLSLSLQQIETTTKNTPAASPAPATGSPLAETGSTAAPTMRTTRKTKKFGQGTSINDTPIPTKDGVNPFAAVAFDPTRVQDYRAEVSVKGHMMAVSNCAIHPRKPILCTVSDDNTWKVWTSNDGELIMTGEGHTDWVSGCSFHPSGTHLATSGGDSTVKIWDFATASCASTFTSHSQAVWSVAWHHTGQFVASASQDQTIKLLDIESLRCRQTLRGHVDSVNSVAFLPYTNTIISASGDKTVSMWDVRSGMCVQTFYGHTNACNYAAVSLKGDSIASCDADGVVKVWDVRACAETTTVAAGPYPANKAAFDISGSILAVASDDGTVKSFDLAAGRHIRDFAGHDDAVQAVAFDPAGGFMVTCSSDSSFKVWH